MLSIFTYEEPLQPFQLQWFPQTTHHSAKKKMTKKTLKNRIWQYLEPLEKYLAEDQFTSISGIFQVFIKEILILFWKAELQKERRRQGRGVRKRERRSCIWWFSSSNGHKCQGGISLKLGAWNSIQTFYVGTRAIFHHLGHFPLLLQAH